MKTITINKLPIPTWTWLKVNDRTVELNDYISGVSPKIIDIPMEIEVDNEYHDFKNPDFLDMELGAGEGLGDLIRDCGAISNCYRVKKGDKCQTALRLNVDYNDVDEASTALSRLTFILEDEAEMTCVIFFKGKSVSAINDIRIMAGKKACLTLVEIFDLQDDSTFVDSIGGNYDEKSGLKLTHVMKSQGDISLGLASNLVGYKSYLDIDTGYLVKGNDKLDINYVSRHRGRLTDTKINVSGVLRDTAKKTFRGTIDFIKGCKDATGDEREDVLLMDPGVHNNTVPLILCAEEDVEGAHGASIGKISDEILFYLQARGIPEEQINELMAKSRIDAVIGRISDEATRAELLGNE
ncbi:MAG: SufD family Fe-S cluster assembly protein [Eubacterium sp.]|nr:SufD family Fe-S cluster assembly protein [Eubacterium sp.]